MRAEPKLESARTDACTTGSTSHHGNPWHDVLPVVREHPAPRTAPRPAPRATGRTTDTVCRTRRRQATVASANGSTADAPARRSSRPATVTVHRLSTRSSTSSTGPWCDANAAASSGSTTKVSHTPASR